MAAIFQIKRGTTNETLNDGELYLHKTSGSLQIGSGSSVVTLAKLNEQNIGNFNLTGDITIGGNIYLGNSVATDNISALGVFTTNLVPNGTIDLGTTSAKWNNVYGNSIWGAISASNGVISGSAQFIGVLSSLNSYTSSQDTKNNTLGLYTASVDAKFTTLQSLTSSNLNRLSRLEESTSSLNAFSASQNTKDSTLALYTASVDAKFTTLQTLTASNVAQITRLQESTASLNLFTSSQDVKNLTLQTLTASMAAQVSRLQESTASLNTFSASASNRLSRIEESTSSLNVFSASENSKSETLRLYTASVDTKWLTLQNVTSSILSYTQSLRDAITVTGVDAASTTTIKGNLYVQGTQTVVDSTTLNIADNVITLNAAGTNDGGLVVRDSTGASTTSGSLLWDVTNDYWKIGKLNSESQILTVGGMGVVSGSLLSLNTFSASTLGHIADINTKTGSFETKFNTLGLYTASLDTKNNTLQTLTASVAAQISRLQESTASLNIFTASQETKNSTLATYTASVSGHITDINTKTGSFENKFTILQSVTASFNTATASLNTFSASINGHVTDINIWTASVNTKFTTLQSVTASLNSATASLFISSSQLTASLTQLRSDFATLQTSVDPNSISGHLTDINAWTASVKGHIVDINIKTGSFEAKFSTLQTYTASINGHVADINAWSASVKGHIVDINSKTGSYETTGRGIISGSSQISSLLPSGVVSGSAQISGSIFNTITGDILITSNGLATIQANSVALGVDTTGNYMSDLTQGTGVTISHTPGEGSNATISIAQAVATTSNVQFGSIGVGTTASGASGEIRATGDITAYYSSDERLKENIQPIVNALSKVESINGNTYDWKEGFEEIHSHKGSDLGVIAQEVQSVLPDVVKERDNGYLAVDYIKLVPVLIEAIKELSAKVKELENK